MPRRGRRRVPAVDPEIQEKANPMTPMAPAKRCGFCRTEDENPAPRCRSCGSPATADLGRSATPPLHAGDVMALGRFTVHALVASTRTSSTYRARDRHLGDEAWLHCRHQDLEPADLDAIDAALEPVRALRHVHVAALEDVFAERGLLFVSYPRQRAEGLLTWFHEAIRTRPERRTALAWSLIGALVDALEYAHAKHVAHGALTATDVAISAEGDGLAVRLCGLGLAQALAPRSEPFGARVAADLVAVVALARRLLGSAADDPRWSDTLQRAAEPSAHDRPANLFAFAAEIAPWRGGELPDGPAPFPLAEDAPADDAPDAQRGAPTGTPLGELFAKRETARDATHALRRTSETLDVEEERTLAHELDDDAVPDDDGAVLEDAADAFAEDDTASGAQPPPSAPAAPRPPAPEPPRSAPARGPTTGRERLAAPQPLAGGEPGTVARTETYFLNARYWSRMIRGRTYPVDLLATSREIRRVLREHQAQVVADTGVRVQAERRTMRFVPRFPGCLAVPAEASFPVSRDRVTGDERTTPARTQLWLTPLATGTFADACIDVYLDDEHLMALKTPTTVVTHVLAKLSAALAVLLPILSSVLRGFELTLEDQIRRGFPVLQWIGEHVTGPLWNVAFFTAFAGIAALAWYVRRARTAEAVEPVGTLDGSTRR